jgi:hypothetical protein
MAASTGIQEEFFTDMNGMRDALGMAYKWFIHVTPLDRVQSICQRGLLPHADAATNDFVRRHIGGCGEIVCFHPLGALMVPGGTAASPLVTLAIVRDDLPLRIGVDFSQMGAYGLAEELRKDRSERSAAEIFVEVARRLGSIISFDAVRPSALRAFVGGCPPHNPLTWPLLVNVRDEALLTH